MDEGVRWMLWLNRTSGKAPFDVVDEAVSYYSQKFGRAPNRVLVPEEFPESSVDGILVERRRNVSSGHVMVAFDPDPPDTSNDHNDHHDNDHDQDEHDNHEHDNDHDDDSHDDDDEDAGDEEEVEAEAAVASVAAAAETAETPAQTEKEATRS